MRSVKKDAKGGRGRPTLSAEQREAMRERIASSAQILFQSQGYGMVSMRRLAQEVGCSPMTLYNYYPAKIDILRTLWSGVFADVFARVAAADRPRAQAHKRLEATALAYAQYWIEHPEHYRLVFMAEGVTQPEVSVFIGDEEIARRFLVFPERLADALGCKASGAVVQAKTHLLLCTLHGVAHSLVTMSGYRWTEPKVMVRDAVRGLLA